MMTTRRALLFREAVKTGILPGLSTDSARLAANRQVFPEIGINVVVDLWRTRRPHGGFVLNQQRQRHEADDDAAKAKKSYLPIAHRKDLLKS
jgi:hypothetical protein